MDALDSTLTDQDDFFGRVELINVVHKKLRERRPEGVLIGFYGIGGIGKSALLRRLLDLTTYSFLVDFASPKLNNVYDRLRALAAQAKMKGLQVKRYSYLEDIRSRLNGEGNPRQGDQSWYETLIDLVSPFSLIDLTANVIAAIGKKIARLISNHSSSLEKWLRTKLGEDYGKAVVEIVQKSPDKMIYLLMMALAEDLNTTKFPEPARLTGIAGTNGSNEIFDKDIPLLIMLDEFDRDELRPLRLRLEGYAGRISISTLWQIFLSRIQRAVCVIAGRILPDLPDALHLMREDHMLVELDEESCVQLLEKRGIPESDPPGRLRAISEICHWHPEALNAFCDAWAEGPIDDDELQSLQAESLALVRERIWQKMMDRAPDLSPLLETACFLTYFNYQILLAIHEDLRMERFKRLVNLSCMEFDGEYYRIHDLAREAAHASSSEDELEATANIILKRLMEEYTRTQDARLLGLAISVQAIHNEDSAFKLMRTKIEELQNRQRNIDAIAVMDAIRFKDKYHRAVLLGMQCIVNQYLNRFGDAEEAGMIAVLLFEELAQTSPTNHERDLATTLINLGNLFISTRQYDRAEQYYLRAKEILDRLVQLNLSGVEIERANVLSNLGSLYGDTKRYDDAVECLQEAIEIQERLMETDPKFPRDDFATVLNNIGTIYFETKEYDRAEHWLLRALRIREQLTKANPDLYEQGLAATLDNLGLLYNATRNYEKAKQYFLRALEIKKRLATIDPLSHEPKLAALLSNLGLLYYRVKQYERAEQYFLEALKIRERLTEANPEVFEPQLAGILNNLGLLYYKMHQYERAEQCHLRALDIRERLAKVNPAAFEAGLATTLNNLGLLSKEMQQYDKAENYYRRAIAIKERLDQENHSVFGMELAMTMMNLGIVYMLEKRFEDAEEYYLQALEIGEQMVSANPQAFEPGFAEILNKYAKLLSITGRFQDAEQYFHRALKIYEDLVRRSPSYFDQNLADILNSIADLSRNTQKYKQAEQYYLRALEILERLAKNNPIVYESRFATVLHKLGDLYRILQRYDHAEQYYQRALVIWTRLTEKNPDLFRLQLSQTLNSLGILYAETDEFRRAETYFRRALEIDKRLVKQDPISYKSIQAIVLNNLALMHTRTQQYDKAEIEYLRAIEIYDQLAFLSPDDFEPDLAFALHNLGSLYHATKQYDKAVKFFERSLTILKRLAMVRPVDYALAVAKTGYSLGFCLLLNKNWQAAEQMLSSSIPVFFTMKDTESTVQFDIVRARSLLCLAQFMQDKIQDAGDTFNRYIRALCSAIKSTTDGPAGIFQKFFEVAAPILKDTSSVLKFLDVLIEAAKSQPERSDICVTTLLNAMEELRERLHEVRNDSE